MLKISFLGASGTVTGSKYLIESSGKKYLIDCGLFQGLKEWRLRNWEPLPCDPKTIDGVILTHAHLDHTGYLPLLVKQGFRKQIYASSATRDLCKILLLDAGRLQEEDAKRANRYGYSKHRPALPLYTEDDAKEVLSHFSIVDFHKAYPLDDQMQFSLSHAGHILGSSMVTLTCPQGSLIFTGDLGRPHDPILIPPEQILSADYLVLESTYGARKHAENRVLNDLEEIINTTVAKGGTILIPAFAVGRTQTILYYLDQLRKQNRISPQIPIYLDSPMAQDATQLLQKHKEEHRLSAKECAEICSIAHYVQSQEDSKRINLSPFPSIIISASGMAEGGRVLHHLARYAPGQENAIVFTGFQAEGTRGARLLRGEKEIKIHGQMVPVRARIESLDELSSHADYVEILAWLKGFKKGPRQVFLTHGEPDAAESLKQKIEQTLGWPVTIPRYLESVELYGSAS